MIQSRINIYSLYLYIVATIYYTLCPLTLILMIGTYENDRDINKGANTYITTMVGNAFSIPFYFSQGWYYWNNAYSHLYNVHYIKQLTVIFINIVYIIVIMTCNGILMGAGYFYPHTLLQSNIIVGAYMVYIQLLNLLVSTIYSSIKRDRNCKQVYFPYHPFYMNLDEQMEADIPDPVNILNDNYPSRISRVQN